MQYIPNTTIKICKVPLNSDQKNQIDFRDKNSQYNYFNSRVINNGTFDKFTYQRKDLTIRVPVNAEYLYSLGANYVMYDNANFTNKWIYAFILKIEYVNDQVSLLHIKTDVYQTWFLDCKINSCFISRETVINDDLFKHTLPESLPTGEQITIKTTAICDNMKAGNADDFEKNYYCVVMTSERIKFISNVIPRIDSFVGGIANPCYMYATTLSSFYDFMDKINENGQANAVVSCVAIPKFFCNYHSLEDSPTPPTPIDPTDNNYLGSPFSGHFNVTQTYNPPVHYGMDMVGIDNKNIYSTVTGTVVDARWQNDSDHSAGYGQLVRIQDDNTGLYFIFGHLSSYTVKTGDKVVKGQLIGVEGNTGNSTGSHLHYQVSTGWNDGTQNPANYGQFKNVEGTQ